MPRQHVDNNMFTARCNETDMFTGEVSMIGTCLYCNVYGLLWAIKEHAF